MLTKQLSFTPGRNEFYMDLSSMAILSTLADAVSIHRINPISVTVSRLVLMSQPPTQGLMSRSHTPLISALISRNQELRFGPGVSATMQSASDSATLRCLLRCHDCEKQHETLSLSWASPVGLRYMKPAPDRLTLCYPGSSLVDSLRGVSRSHVFYA